MKVFWHHAGAAPKRFGPLLFLCVAVAAASGCSYPPALHTYAFLLDYERMSDRCDPLVSLVYAPGEKTLENYRIFFIDEITVAEQGIESQETAEKFALRFRYLLRNKLMKSGKFDLVTLEAADLAGQGAGMPAARLEGMVTRFDMGSGWRRYFFSQGATDFQIEGRLTDAASGDLIMEFADRRRELGNSFGPSPKTFDKVLVMKVTVTKTVDCLVKFLSEVAYRGLPAEEK